MSLFASISWFPFSLAATILFGIAIAFYKLPAVKKQSKFVTVFWLLLASWILSLILFHSYLYLTTLTTVIAGLVWGITFTGLALLQMYALNRVETNVLFPVTTTLSLVVAVIVGLLFFGETLSLLQGLGILIVIGTVFSYLYEGGEIKYSKLIIYVGLGIIAISAFNKVLQKIVADNIDIHAFQIYQYGFAALAAFLAYLFFHRKESKQKRLHNLTGGALKTGGTIGFFSFLGGYSLLIALTKGPFSLITSIHSLYILVTAIVGWILFKENLTKKKVFLIILVIIALILMRVG